MPCLGHQYTHTHTHSHGKHCYHIYFSIEGVIQANSILEKSQNNHCTFMSNVSCMRRALNIIQRVNLICRSLILRLDVMFMEEN